MLSYLATPYTKGAGSVEDRVDAACKTAAVLMKLGKVIFCPVAHSHAVADHLDDGLRFDHEFWMTQDLRILKHCDELIALKYPGWEESAGMAREIAAAKAIGIPVKYLPWEDVEEVAPNVL